MQRPDQTWTQGKNSFLPSLSLPLDDAWPHGPKDHWLKTTWVSTELKWRHTTTDHTRLWDPKCHQSGKTIVDFSTAHPTRNTIAARMWFLFFGKNLVFHYCYFFTCFVKQGQKREKKEQKEQCCCLFVFKFCILFDHVLPPNGFVSIQIQMVVSHVNGLDCWPLFIFFLGFLLYLRYAIHVLEYGSQKSSIVTHISTCFLVHFVFFCFLICLFHVPSFLSFFKVFSVFHSFLFFHVFSFLFISCIFFSLEKPITNPDHSHVDPLSFAHLATCPYRLLMSRPLPAQHAMLAGRQLRWKLHCHRHRGRDVQAVSSTAAGDGGDFEEVGSTAGVIITWDFYGLFKGLLPTVCPRVALELESTTCKM